MGNRERAVIALVAGAALAGAATAAQYDVTPGGKNLVRFESRAPLETVTGKTREVRGTVHLDPASLGDSIEVDLEVDLSRLDTGIELRNKHMRENHLHTDRWPKATFRGGRVSERSHDALTAGRRTTFTLAGRLELHGEARRVSVPVAITPQPDGGLRVESRFQVKLSDHGIPRPQFLVMKLDDVQHIDLDLVLSRHAGK